MALGFFFSLISIVKVDKYHLELTKYRYTKHNQPNIINTRGD